MVDVTSFAAASTAIGSALPLFATVFGLVALAGGAAGYFKASRGDTIIKYQATEIDLRDKKITSLEKDLAATTEACATKDETIKKQDEHNKYLQKLVQQSPQLKKLTTAIENQTKVFTEFMKGRKK